MRFGVRNGSEALVMSYLTRHCRRSVERLTDNRELCQASTIILAMCLLCGLGVAILSLILQLTQAV